MRYLRLILVGSAALLLAAAQVADEQDGTDLLPVDLSAARDPAPSAGWYDGHRVVRVHVRNTAELDLLLTTTDDVWSHHVPGETIDVRVSPEQFAQLSQTGLPFEILIDDLQPLIDAEAAKIEARRHMDGLDWFENYKTLAEIEARIDQLAGLYPHLAQHWVIGQSIEGRDIHALIITDPGGSGDRPVFLITGCQHAREWVGPMTAMFVADQLLENYAGSARIQDILDGMQFVIAPMMNPDGYVYSWTTMRLWRKNRNPLVGGGCVGVDLNRNWSFEWGGAGASPDPCDNTYRGWGPLSEPETSAFADFVTGSGKQIAAYIDFHSYSQVVASPWSYTCDPPPNLGLFNELGKMMADAIHSVHGQTYEYGPACTKLYVASGTAKDWGFGQLGALSWTIELRPDTKPPGFLLPPEEILPTAEENFEAVLQLAEYWTTAVWVDFAYVGIEWGTFDRPFNTLAEGVAAVALGGRVIVKAGSSNETLEISKPLTLEGYGGIVTIGQ